MGHDRRAVLCDGRRRLLRRPARSGAVRPLGAGERVLRAHAPARHRRRASRGPTARRPSGRRWRRSSCATGCCPTCGARSSRPATTGLPVQRAMALACPDEPEAWAFDHQFFCGDDLLVAPCLDPVGSRARLPAQGRVAPFPGRRGIRRGADARARAGARRAWRCSPAPARRSRSGRRSGTRASSAPRRGSARPGAPAERAPLPARNSNAMSYIRVVRHRIIVLPSFSSGVRAAHAAATRQIQNSPGEHKPCTSARPASASVRWPSPSSRRSPPLPPPARRSRAIRSRRSRRSSSPRRSASRTCRRCRSPCRS